MESSSNIYEDKSSLYRRLSWFILIVIEILLGLRFVLKFVGPDPGSEIPKFVYTVTQPLASPFLNALGNFKDERSVLEWTTLVAMALYWIIAWIIIRIFLTDHTVSTTESEKKYK
jgi:uncharacterized protein YggT (Ycf19 family)